MHKQLLLILVLSFFLTGCAPPSPAPETALPRETAAAPVTVPATEAAAEPSSLIIPGITQEDVIRYFNEICLDAEFVHSGDPSRLQKWDVPIRYWIYGSPTPEDLTVFTGFRDWLNTIDGFPGIGEAEEPNEVNLRIHFCSQEDMLSLMGEDFSGTDGAVTFWYDNDAIYDAILCIRTDLDQELRSSVILEELYNALGPIQDTRLREDSIIYAGFSQPQELTEVDKLLLKLLYRPELKCGMDARECEILIRELYI